MVVVLVLSVANLRKTRWLRSGGPRAEATHGVCNKEEETKAATLERLTHAVTEPSSLTVFVGGGGSGRTK